MAAKTGGRISAEEQRKYGGEPEKCMIYELFTYGIVKNDEELKEIYEDCRSGKMLCGHCKKKAYELITEFLDELREKREQARDVINEYLP